MNFPTNTFTKLIVATDIDFKNVIFYDIVNSPLVVEEIKSLKYVTKYYWKVKTVNAFNGAESEWSEVCSFTTRGENISILHSTLCMVYYSFKNERECAQLNGGSLCQVTGNTLEEYAIRRGFLYCGRDLSAARY